MKLKRLKIGMEINSIYSHIKENFQNTDVEDLYNKYNYYIEDIDCYASYFGDRTCTMCKAVKPLLYKNCKEDYMRWKAFSLYCKGVNK